MGMVYHRDNKRGHHRDLPLDGDQNTALRTTCSTLEQTPRTRRTTNVNKEFDTELRQYTQLFPPHQLISVPIGWPAISKRPDASTLATIQHSWEARC